jgi:serine/threonine protein kinase
LLLSFFLSLFLFDGVLFFSIHFLLSPSFVIPFVTGQISEEAKDLVRGMMHPKAKDRLTINQCLDHPWLLV